MTFFPIMNNLHFSVAAIVEFLEYPLFFLKYLNVTQISFKEEEIEKIKVASCLVHTQKVKKQYFFD